MSVSLPALKERLQFTTKKSYLENTSAKWRNPSHNSHFAIKFKT